VQVDPAVGSYTLPGIGTFAPGSQSVTFLPGPQRFNSSPLVFDFTVLEDDTFGVDPTPGVTGDGTSVLAVSVP
jgi:hypothetical protein